ncbi:chemotaxis protein CheW [Geomonas sp. RF6]|uniref:chemotaxis protein CheW n=1 Tax=Geomonas sp. RF6 TaxID=2897342 RepID=UPI001E3E9BDA|nr:chemotaxis protein CheW [Geomonas sp. RF6]UFS71565.1 chemotaxis protein CheW [Geomonas sp. RF6]
MPRRFLTFHAGGERYALELSDVAEVTEPRQTFPLPVAPEYFAGIFNSHGTLTAVVDLSRYLGRGGRAAEGKFLLLDKRLASLALWVDEVGAIVREDPSLSREPAEDPLLEALLQTEDGAVKLIRIEALLALLEEGVAAAAPEQNHNHNS